MQCRGIGSTLVTIEEDLKVRFKFGFEAVVEHRQRMGKTQSDPSNEMVNKMTRL
jgi:hypothetical protein